MITEFALIGAAGYGYKRIKERNLYKVKKIFRNLIDNNSLDYKIIEARENQYGYSIIASLYGQGYDKLSKLQDLLESTYGATIQITQNPNIKTATIDIITEMLNDKTKFTPVKTKSYEIYAGESVTRKPLISSLNKYPHTLVSGQTGSGKTEEIRLILSNLIYCHNERDINIYFSDLSDSNDFYLFKNLKQVKGYSKNINDSAKLFDYLMHIYSKRLDIFESRDCKNIDEYNSTRYNERMNYIYIVLDEFADYFPASKLENEYELKVKCYNTLKHLIRKARKIGMFFIIGIQRPDTTVLDPSLRSGLCTKIGFSQNTDSSSLVVCDTVQLTNIEQRKGLFMYGNVREWFRSLYINDSLIKEYIKDSRVTDVYNRKDFNKFLGIENKEVDNITSLPITSKSKTKVKK